MIRNTVQPQLVDDIVWSTWKHVVGFKPNMKLTNSYEHKRSEYNTKLWNESSDDASPQRKQVRTQKRRLTYISNIYVISDPKNPENEGKVFLFKYGKKIFDKITMLMNPEFEGDDPVNPFDFWKGANFKLRIRNVEGYRNYDQSTFESPSALLNDDSKLEDLWKSQYSLKELIAPDKFKSYDELKKKLYEVLEINEKSVVAPAPKAEDPFKSASKRMSVQNDDDDDDLAAFKALAE